MAKPKRSLETLVASIKETLQEGISEGQEFFAAQWGEADGDACYLVSKDGRMVGLGDYQYGFSSVDDLLSTTHSEEVQGYARSEAGRIAGGLEPLDLAHIETGRDDYGVKERLPGAFGVDARVAEKAMEQEGVAFVDLFALLANIPAKQVFPNQSTPRDLITMDEDLVVCRLVMENGKPAWSQEVVAKAGDSIKADVSHGSAFAHVADGLVRLDLGSFQPAPAPRRTPGP